MTGLCTGKVRSTPTPKLILRTVKVSRSRNALAGDDDALEDLDARARALDDADVDLDGVAGPELGDVVAQRDFSTRSTLFIRAFSFPSRAGGRAAARSGPGRHARPALAGPRARGRMAAGGRGAA
jgi:hypothetical protein